MSPMSNWIKNAQSLLAPSFSQCLICGKRSQTSSQLPDVCVHCAAAIPWIHSPRCLKCGRHVGCPDCTRSGEPSPLICNRSAVAYNSVMREILGQYKYRGNERYAPLLGLMLDRAYDMLKAERERDKLHLALLPKKLPEIPFLPKKSSRPKHLWKADLLVPVPVSDSRLIERGFNQAERLGNVLSLRRGIPQLPLLIRTHHTGKQSFKSRAERLTDMKHAFAPDPDMKKVYADWLQTQDVQARTLRILIIDDIYTTGSTIRACADSLQQLTDVYANSAEIYSLTLARS